MTYNKVTYLYSIKQEGENYLLNLINVKNKDIIISVVISLVRHVQKTCVLKNIWIFVLKIQNPFYTEIKIIYHQEIIPTYFIY